MNTPITPIQFAPLSLFLLMAAGCELPLSEHPLSNEKTSVADERLIGEWEEVPREMEEKKDHRRIAIGRKNDQPNVLEAAGLSIKDGHVVVERAPLYTVKLKGEVKGEPDERRYMSFNMADKGKPKYLIMTYTLSDEGRLVFYAPDTETIAKDIEGGKLEGRVRRNERKPGEDPNKEKKYKEILITADPKTLREYFEAKGMKCFNQKETIEYRRLDLD